MSALLATLGVSVAGAAFGVLLAAKSSGFARAGQVGVFVALFRALVLAPVPVWERSGASSGTPPSRAEAPR